MTSESFRDKIEELCVRLEVTCKIYCIPCESIFEAACSRLRIFDYPEISKYEKLLYLDTDILIRRDLTPIFSLDLEDNLYGIPSGTLKSLHFGGNFFDFSTIDSSLSGLNSGTLLFKSSVPLQCLFSRIIKHIEEYSSSGKVPPYALDQPFINYHAFSSNMYNTTLIKPYVSLYEDTLIVDNEETAAICHFSYPIGDFEHKYARMSTFFKNLLITPVSRSRQMDIIGKKFSFGSGYIKIIITCEGYYEVETRWGKGLFHILDSKTIYAIWNNYYHVIKFNSDCTEYMSIRTNPTDFDYISGSLQESYINIYGDSHAMLSFRHLQLEHRNLFQHSKTMYRVGRDTEIINFHPSHNNVKRIFCLSYGEVDVRAHIGKQVILGRTYETVCKELVTMYVNTIRTVITQYKSIILVAISPPVALDDHSSCKGHADELGGPIPFIGTDEERVKYTLYMNRLIEEACNIYGFIFFNPYTEYIRNDGCLKYELSDTCIHVGKNESILSQFTECISTINKV
jgi:hypothetical protein